MIRVLLVTLGGLVGLALSEFLLFAAVDQTTVLVVMGIYLVLYGFLIWKSMDEYLL